MYREQESRWVVLMSVADMQREGLDANDYVSLGNETLTYFPEANVLIPKTTDQRSKTPSYKSVLVELLNSNKIMDS